MNEEASYTLGSGNVFHDIGVAEPEAALVKAELARRISELIREQGLTQAAAADRMSLDQPKVSAITRGRLSGFSLERLLECLGALRQDVIISIVPASEEQGRIRVAA
jgi:predicted XRE-type DNA-binding protein